MKLGQSAPNLAAGTKLTQALKEWHVAVQALAQGESIVLLRKGGIREESGKFLLHADRVLLYPTFEHQQPHLLKPPYDQQVQPVESGWHPETVEISAWADITETIALREPEPIEALLPFHIWNSQFVSERLKWKPSQPLYVLLLRVFRLPQPTQIAVTEALGGCKSWIELPTAIDLTQSTAVLSEAEYSQQIESIHQAIPPRLS